MDRGQEGRTDGRSDPTPGRSTWPTRRPRPAASQVAAAGATGRPRVCTGTTYACYGLSGGATEMPAKPFVVTPKDYAPTLDIVGGHVTVLASEAGAQGDAVLLQRGHGASRPPPHSNPC